eukprot:403376336
MKYTFCPRRTNACGTSGPLLYPLFDSNSSVIINSTMNETIGDVCYWEIKVNVTQFQNNHPDVDLTWTYINIVINNATNLITYLTQGETQKTVGGNVKINPAPGRNFKFYLNNGGSVFLIAYPSDQNTYRPTFLNFTFNYTTDYYNNMEISWYYLSDYVQEGFWEFVYVALSLFLAAIFCIILCIQLRNFDPLTQFEKRREEYLRERVRQRKELKLKEIEEIEQLEQEISIRKQQYLKDKKAKLNKTSNTNTLTLDEKHDQLLSNRKEQTIDFDDSFGHPTQKIYFVQKNTGFPNVQNKNQPLKFEHFDQILQQDYTQTQTIQQQQQPIFQDSRQQNNQDSAMPFQSVKLTHENSRPSNPLGFQSSPTIYNQQPSPQNNKQQQSAQSKYFLHQQVSSPMYKENPIIEEDDENPFSNVHKVENKDYDNIFQVNDFTNEQQFYEANKLENRRRSTLKNVQLAAQMQPQPMQQQPTQNQDRAYGRRMSTLKSKSSKNPLDDEDDLDFEADVISQISIINKKPDQKQNQPQRLSSKPIFTRNLTKGQSHKSLKDNDDGTGTSCDIEMTVRYSDLSGISITKHPELLKPGPNKPIEEAVKSPNPYEQYLQKLNQNIKQKEKDQPKKKGRQTKYTPKM